MRAVLQLLAPLPVWAAASALPPHQYRVCGRSGMPAQRVHVTLPDLTAARTFVRELPGHLAAPPVYRLALPERCSIEFVCGYQDARRACLPHERRFQAACDLGAASSPCPYPSGSDAARAYRDGARAYLGFVLTFAGNLTPPEAARGARSGKEQP